MGKIYFPEWDNRDENPIRMLEDWVRENRDAIQISLNMEIIKAATKENKCPNYDGRGSCALYPELHPCPSDGKLTNKKCSFYRLTLDGLMKTFERNVREYGEKRSK